MKANACRLDATGPEIYYAPKAVSWQFAIKQLQDLGINMSAHSAHIPAESETQTNRTEEEFPETP